MDKILKLYTYMGEGVEDALFPNTDNPIEIGAFRYDAKRMGGAPTITASVNYPSCLDDEWTDNVYAEFNGEKYYLKQTPTSSYDNQDAMYKHDITLVSERVALDNVYFFDVVTGDPMDSDKPVSNSTKVVFFGDVREFASRLQDSLEYSGLSYTVVIDDGIETEEKLMSFEDQFFSNVLQEIYNTFEVPYYFDGKVIHIGYSKEGVVIPDLAYGVDNALLSITKNNANYKIVNRATATGSSDNIPFYYPNNSPKGEINAIASSDTFAVTIVDAPLFSDKIALDGVITRTSVDYENLVFSFLGESFISGVKTWTATIGAGGIKQSFDANFDAHDVGSINLSFSSQVKNFWIKDEKKEDATFEVRYYIRLYHENKKVFESKGLDEINEYEIPIEKEGHYKLAIDTFFAPIGKYAGKSGRIEFGASYNLGSETGWVYDDKPIDLKDIGLKVDGQVANGDTITQTLVKYVKTSQNLLPSVYRETDGKERFYNATNGTYEGITFNNPFVEGHPKEHIITVEDIKPSIKEMVNSMGLRMDMFSEFAYDLDDNDELVENENESQHEYVHSYFFAKLRKLDFNLFDHAIEQQPMTISFTSGDCGACNFTIGVTEEFPQKNPVQVNADGTLKRDAKGRVVCGQFEEITEDECQPQQQDTINNEVWIALKKEDSTYGILMPKSPKFNEKGEQIEAGHRPKACSAGKNDGDTFVILGINLPLSYILNAEKKLEAEIIKYLKENNDEKFTFSIDFSRIFFEENATVLNQLSENSKIRIIYDEKPYDLYVSSFSYNMSDSNVLPEIKVELDDTLKVSQNALQNAISQVKSELGRAIGNIDVLGAANPYFIRKDADDEARGKINFTKGIKFGEGGKVEILDNNSAKLTIEYLEVTKKASFTSLEIQEKTHVGGQILVTPASINCGEVEELDDVYRCYFQTKGVDGDEIFNQFAVGDQAICQTYNAWGSKYYWRLVTGIGEDYIDLSKTECDEDSGIPSAGDKIIQLGNQIDEERQNAIVIAAYGDGSPYIIQYKGVDNFEIPDSKIVTKLSSTENIFTGKVHMEMGSDGLENIEGGLNIGGQNLLRNSGFTGNYLSNTLTDGKVLEEADKMFNPPLAHWDEEDAPATNAIVQNSDVSASGKEVSLSMGSITQTLYQKTIANETYILSFKAKGASLTYSVGGVSKKVSLTEEWAKYSEKITMVEDGSTFAITDATCVLCDIQLERGTIATAWGNSPFDNASDRAYYQSMKYIQNAFEGATDVLGGLVLTEQIQVGDYDTDKKEWVKMNGGMSGVYESDHDVAFWAGGNINQAIETVMMYDDNPTLQPTEEQLASMAKFVVTHGGKAILNDIILRGIIYAKGGSFGDLKIGKYVNACGQADTEDSVFTERAHSVGNMNYKTMVQMASGSIRAFGTHRDDQYCYFGNAFEVDADSDTNENRQGAVVRISATTVDAMLIEDGDIVQKNGHYRGFRPQMMVITDDTNLDTFDSGITIVADTTNTSIYLDLLGARYGGSNFEIHKVGNGTLVIGDDPTNIYYKGQLYSQYTIDDECCIKIIYSEQTKHWYMVIV